VVGGPPAAAVAAAGVAEQLPRESRGTFTNSIQSTIIAIIIVEAYALAQSEDGQ